MNYRALALIAFVNVLGLVSVGDGSAALGLGLLSPLVPIAHITGHAGLWAHGLTGAALLKLKAAAGLGALFLLSGRGIEVNLGNDHHHHHEHEHDHGWGWARKRRDVSDVASEPQEDAAAAEEQEVYDPSLDEIMNYDQLGCGMRLVCELSATPYSRLQDDEKLILELFGRDGKAPMPSKASKGKLTYSYASILGANAKDGARACRRVYGQCPYTGVQIMQSLREAQV